MKTTECICQECGETFMEWPHNVRRGRGLYCSVKCRRPAAARKRQARRKADIGIWFWEKVDRSKGPNACWPWQGTKYPAGYGRLIMDGRFVLAHRQAYSLLHGGVPAALFVCHHCDNPPCCNPKHLFLGDHAANMRDRQQKGNYPNGEKHPRARLAQRDVDTIRDRLAAGETASAISRDYHVHLTTVCSIRDGKTWKPLKAMEAGDG